MMEAGMILIVSAIELNQDDLDVIYTGIPPERILTIWVGKDKENDLPAAVKLSGSEGIENSVKIIKELMTKQGILSYNGNNNRGF
jgi:bifunctional enzyme CysN/CysC